MRPASLFLAMLLASVLLPVPGRAYAQSPAASSDPEPDLSRPREVPEDLDTSRRRTSDDGRFVVFFKSMKSRPKINAMHNWSVRVTLPDGQPVNDAHIDVNGGMPAHNHGFPTQPRVTRRISPGVYLIEGVKFNMTGWWQFDLKIRVGEHQDRVRVNVVIED